MSCKYVGFWPKLDSLSNSGWFVDIDDFKRYPEEEFREATKNLPTEIPADPPGPTPGGVWLAVEDDGKGITYGQLRKAADRARRIFE